jgi:hypothetical protein
MKQKLVIRAMALLLLAAVFTAYLQPGLMISLSEQLWACF